LLKTLQLSRRLESAHDANGANQEIPGSPGNAQ
jgi:hypothetical protein